MLGHPEDCPCCRVQITRASGSKRTRQDADLTTFLPVAQEEAEDEDQEEGEGGGEGCAHRTLDSSSCATSTLTPPHGCIPLSAMAGA